LLISADDAVMITVDVSVVVAAAVIIIVCVFVVVVIVVIGGGRGGGGGDVIIIIFVVILVLEVLTFFSNFLLHSFEQNLSSCPISSVQFSNSIIMCYL
jgi:hypothetical protein